MPNRPTSDGIPFQGDRSSAGDTDPPAALPRCARASASRARVKGRPIGSGPGRPIGSGERCSERKQSIVALSRSRSPNRAGNSSTAPFELKVRRSPARAGPAAAPFPRYTWQATRRPRGPERRALPRVSGRLRSGRPCPATPRDLFAARQTAFIGLVLPSNHLRALPFRQGWADPRALLGRSPGPAADHPP